MKLYFRPFLSVLLMCSSLILLVLFEAVWLRQVYNEKYEALRKETDVVFRNTMLDIQDSLVKKGMEPVAGDSGRTLPFPHGIPLHPLRETMPVHGGMPERVFIERHSLAGRDSLQEHTQVRVYISSDQQLDSTDRVLGNIAENIAIQRRKKGNYNFVVKLNIDSIPVKAIAGQYRKALSSAGIPLPFQVIRFFGNPPATAGIHTAPFMSFPVDTRYMAFFPVYESYLFRSCIPHALFSLFLTVITSFSFYLIYHNFQKQKRLNQVKNDFINNITHELKTPITTVGIAIEAMRSFNVLQNPEQAREYLEISRQELNRLNLMIDKILKAAVFESKGIDLQWGNVNMEQVLEQVQHSMQLQYEKMHADVVVTCEGEGFIVKGDTIHLTNVIYNLIDNALKYTRRQPSIRILLREVWDKVEVSVTDNGVGIASEFQSRIFEKFFRIPTGDVHNAKGYGLGLNYVSQVVEKHRGQIHIQSEPEKGSCFTIYLPKADAKNESIICGR